METAKDFWLLPVEELMALPDDEPMPCHQELLKDHKLVRRRVTMAEVVTGELRKHTAAISHRWLCTEHIDPDGHKVRKLKEIMPQLPFIKHVWLDWACAPQKQDGIRTEEEREEFNDILANILPYMYLGATVIVLWDRVYNQRFWPNVESWTAMRNPTPEGLTAASGQNLRAWFFGILSADGKDVEVRQNMLAMWHNATAEEAINTLKSDDILVTNKKDKETNLKVIASLTDDVRQLFASDSLPGQVLQAPTQECMYNQGGALAATGAPPWLWPVPQETMQPDASPEEKPFPNYISTEEIAGCWLCLAIPFGCALSSKTAMGPDTLLHDGCAFLVFVLPWPVREIRQRHPGTNMFYKEEETSNIDRYHHRACMSNGVSCQCRLW